MRPCVSSTRPSASTSSRPPRRARRTSPSRASRIVSRISDMLDDKVRPLLTQLKTAYARREDATRRDADLAKAVVEDAAHGALLESQREAMQAELMEAKELFCAAEGDLIVGWQKLLCWVAGVLRSPHAG